MLRRPLEPKLDAAIAVVDQIFEPGASMDRLLERVQRQVASKRSGHSPSDDPPREHVRHEGHVDEARPGRDVRDVRDPELVRARGLEAAPDQISRPSSRLIDDRGPLEGPATNGALEAHLAHQTLDRAARDGEALPKQLAPHLTHAVDRTVLLPDALDLDTQRGIAERSA